jgi:hypothetical protein
MNRDGIAEDGELSKRPVFAGVVDRSPRDAFGTEFSGLVDVIEHEEWISIRTALLAFGHKS